MGGLAALAIAAVVALFVVRRRNAQKKQGALLNVRPGCWAADASASTQQSSHGMSAVCGLCRVCHTLPLHLTAEPPAEASVQELRPHPGSAHDRWVDLVQHLLHGQRVSG